MQCARKKLESALESRQLHEIKSALQAYADTVQQVKLQVKARELMTQIAAGNFDETLVHEIVRLTRSQSDGQVNPRDQMLKYIKQFWDRISNDTTLNLIDETESLVRVLKMV